MSLENNKKIVLYDADCGFCEKCRRFCEKRNRKNSLNFIDINSEEASDLFKSYDLKESLKTIWFFNSKEAFNKGYAITEICKNLNTPWNIFYYSKKILPKAFLDFLYDFVAKSKDRFNKNKTCSID